MTARGGEGGCTSSRRGATKGEFEVERRGQQSEEGESDECEWWLNLEPRRGRHVVESEPRSVYVPRLQRVHTAHLPSLFFWFSLHHSSFLEALQAQSRTLTCWKIVNAAASGQDLAVTSRVTCVSPAEPRPFVTPPPPS